MILGLQVFEEKVYDLLPSVKSRSLPFGPRRALSVREDAHGIAYVDGLTEVPCMRHTPPCFQSRPGRLTPAQARSGRHCCA